MAIPIKKKIRVLEARYVDEPDAILILGECEDGKFRQQIPSSCFTFGNKDKKTEMEKLAELLIGKTINMVFDPELNGKIKDHYPLKYK